MSQLAFPWPFQMVVLTFSFSTLHSSGHPHPRLLSTWNKAYILLVLHWYLEYWVFVVSILSKPPTVKPNVVVHFSHPSPQGEGRRIRSPWLPWGKYPVQTTWDPDSKQTQTCYLKVQAISLGHPMPPISFSPVKVFICFPSNVSKHVGQRFLSTLRSFNIFRDINLHPGFLRKLYSGSCLPHGFSLPAQS